MSLREHITVCLCTYRRVALLEEALSRIVRQTVDGFGYSVVVVDNDAQQTARDVVQRVAATAEVPVEYIVEPRRNIALARNAAMERATGDYVAFIDDDEFAERDWLLRLYEAQQEFGADGVLGTVLPRFETEPPSWMAALPNNPWAVERPATGTRLYEGNTGNALVRVKSLRTNGLRFNARYGSTGGEDADFFRRFVDKGFLLISSRESVVYEFVPSARLTASYLVKRNLLRGANACRRFRDLRRSGAFRALWMGKAMAAVVAYALMLPVQTFRSRASLLKCVLQMAYFGGYVAEQVRLAPIRDRRALEG